MKTIIAGSRGIEDYALVIQAVKDCGWVITEVVSGTRRGVDKLGERYAEEYGIPVRRFPARWDDLNAPGAIMKVDKHGRKYNAKAGHDRNVEMAEYAEALIAIQTGESKGTADMISLARKRGLRVYTVTI